MEGNITGRTAVFVFQVRMETIVVFSITIVRMQEPWLPFVGLVKFFL